MKGSEGKMARIESMMAEGEGVEVQLYLDAISEERRQE